MAQKKVITYAFALLLVIVILGAFRVFRLPLLPVHAHQAIPSHSAFFFAAEKNDLLKLITEPTPLAGLLLPKNLGNDFNSLSELITEEKELNDDQKFYITLSPSQNKGIDLLFILPNCSNYDLNNIGKKSGWRNREYQYKNQSLYTLKKGEKECSFTKYRNLLIFAKHAYLVESAINQLKNPSSSICTKSVFKKTTNRINGEEGTFPFFINLGNIQPQFAPLLNPSRFDQLRNISRIGSWVQINIPFLGDSTTWVGSFSPNTDNTLFASNKGKKEQLSEELWQVIPNNLSGFAAIHSSKIENYFSTSPLINFIENEVVLAIGEPLEEDKLEQFFMVKINNAEQLDEEIGKHPGVDTSYDYQMFKIWNLGNAGAFPMFGDQLNFVSVVGNFLLFGNSLQGLERWLGKYIAGQTCSKNVEFLKKKAALEDDTHMLMYMNGIKGWQQIAPYLNEEVTESLKGNPIPFEELLVGINWKRGAGKMEFIKSGQKTLNNAAANILWSVPLLDQAASKPYVFTNPLNGEKDVFIVDNNNRIYLISRSGRILWRRQIPEKILSKITHIHLDSKEEGQFVFSTKSAIYIIDRDGEDVDGFPLELQTDASNGVSVVDFFQSNDYSFFIACENGMAYGFDEKGSPIEGWRPNENIGYVEHPILHFQADGKDFLALLESTGILRVYKKNGSLRFRSVDFDVPELTPMDYQVSKKSSRIVTANPNGRVFVTNLSGDHFGLQLKAGKNENVKFLFTDVLGDERKDYIALSENEMRLYYYDGNKFNKAFDYTYPWSQEEVI